MASLLKKTLESLADAAASAVKTAAQNRLSGGSTSSSSGGGGSSSGSSITGGNRYTQMVGMSASDQAGIADAQRRYKQAEAAGDQAGMDAAHSDAESYRAKYNYSGGQYGSDYIPFLNSKASQGTDRGDGFTYESAPQYVNRYQDKIDELTAQILGREAFSYDPEKDPAYQQYRESYTRSGQRAMQDTLAQLSARTGGLASSYAGSAAQQTYDNYMAELADKVPELRQLAYSMYQDEGNTLRDNLNMLASLEQGDYAKFADQLGQYNTDRNFNYGVYRDDVGDRRYDTEWNYQIGRDQLSDQRYDDETAWNRSQYASETEYNQALAKAQTLAAAGDFSGYKALGYSDAEIKNLKTAYDAAQLLAQRSTGRSGGSSGSRGSGGSSSSGSGSGGNKWSAVEDWVSLYGEDAAEDYIKEHYKDMGYSSQSAALSGWRNHLLESGGNGLTVDMASVLDLGYGPISENRLAELEAAGEIESYEDGGKIRFRRTSRTGGSGRVSIQDVLNLYGR